MADKEEVLQRSDIDLRQGIQGSPELQPDPPKDQETSKPDASPQFGILPQCRVAISDLLVDQTQWQLETIHLQKKLISIRNGHLKTLHDLQYNQLKNEELVGRTSRIESEVKKLEFVISRDEEEYKEAVDVMEGRSGALMQDFHQNMQQENGERREFIATLDKALANEDEAVTSLKSSFATKINGQENIVAELEDLFMMDKDTDFDDTTISVVQKEEHFDVFKDFDEDEFDLFSPRNRSETTVPKEEELGASDMRDSHQDNKSLPIYSPRGVDFWEGGGDSARSIDHGEDVLEKKSNYSIELSRSLDDTSKDTSEIKADLLKLGGIIEKGRDAYLYWHEHGETAGGSFESWRHRHNQLRNGLNKRKLSVNEMNLEYFNTNSSCGNDGSVPTDFQAFMLDLLVNLQECRSLLGDFKDIQNQDKVSTDDQNSGEQEEKSCTRCSKSNTVVDSINNKMKICEDIIKEMHMYSRSNGNSSDGLARSTSVASSCYGTDETDIKNIGPNYSSSGYLASPRNFTSEETSGEWSTSTLQEKSSDEETMTSRISRKSYISIDEEALNDIKEVKTLLGNLMSNMFGIKQGDDGDEEGILEVHLCPSGKQGLLIHVGEDLKNIEAIKRALEGYDASGCTSIQSMTCREEMRREESESRNFEDVESCENLSASNNNVRLGSPVDRCYYDDKYKQCHSNHSNTMRPKTPREVHSSMDSCSQHHNAKHAQRLHNSRSSSAGYQNKYHSMPLDASSDDMQLAGIEQRLSRVNQAVPQIIGKIDDLESQLKKKGAVLKDLENYYSLELEDCASSQRSHASRSCHDHMHRHTYQHQGGQHPHSYTNRDMQSLESTVQQQHASVHRIEQQLKQQEYALNKATVEPSMGHMTGYKSNQQCSIHELVDRYLPQGADKYIKANTSPRKIFNLTDSDFKDKFDNLKFDIDTTATESEAITQLKNYIKNLENTIEQKDSTIANMTRQSRAPHQREYENTTTNAVQSRASRSTMTDDTCSHRSNSTMTQDMESYRTNSTTTQDSCTHRTNSTMSQESCGHRSHGALCADDSNCNCKIRTIDSQETFQGAGLAGKVPSDVSQNIPTDGVTRSQQTKACQCTCGDSRCNTSEAQMPTATKSNKEISIIIEGENMDEITELCQKTISSIETTTKCASNQCRCKHHDVDKTMDNSDPTPKKKISELNSTISRIRSVIADLQENIKGKEGEGGLQRYQALLRNGGEWPNPEMHASYSCGNVHQPQQPYMQGGYNQPYNSQVQGQQMMWPGYAPNPTDAPATRYYAQEENKPRRQGQSPPGRSVGHCFDSPRSKSAGAYENIQSQRRTGNFPPDFDEQLSPLIAEDNEDTPYNAKEKKGKRHKFSDIRGRPKEKTGWTPPATPIKTKKLTRTPSDTSTGSKKSKKGKGSKEEHTGLPPKGNRSGPYYRSRKLSVGASPLSMVPSPLRKTKTSKSQNDIKGDRKSVCNKMLLDLQRQIDRAMAPFMEDNQLAPFSGKGNNILQRSDIPAKHQEKTGKSPNQKGQQTSKETKARKAVGLDIHSATQIKDGGHFDLNQSVAHSSPDVSIGHDSTTKEDSFQSAKDLHPSKRPSLLPIFERNSKLRSAATKDIKAKLTSNKKKTSPTTPINPYKKPHL